jgi:hypothetical protein
MALSRSRAAIIKIDIGSLARGLIALRAKGAIVTFAYP